MAEPAPAAQPVQSPEPIPIAGHPQWRSVRKPPFHQLPLIPTASLKIGQILLVPAQRLCNIPIRVVRDGVEIKNLDLYGYCHTAVILKMEREGKRVWCYVAKIASFSELTLMAFIREQNRSSKVRYKDNIPILPAHWGPVDFPHVRAHPTSLGLQRQVYIDIREMWKVDSGDMWPMYDMTNDGARLPPSSARLTRQSVIDSLAYRNLTLQAIDEDGTPIFGDGSDLAADIAVDGAGSVGGGGAIATDAAVITADGHVGGRGSGGGGVVRIRGGMMVGGHNNDQQPILNGPRRRTYRDVVLGLGRQ